MASKRPHGLINPRTSPVFGVLILLSGLLAMIGKMTATVPLTTLFMGTVPMAMSSALGFVVAGAALATVNAVSVRRHRQCQLLAGLLLLVIGALGILSAQQSRSGMTCRVCRQAVHQ